jgi:hypothetical protein
MLPAWSRQSLPPVILLSGVVLLAVALWVAIDRPAVGQALLRADLPADVEVIPVAIAPAGTGFLLVDKRNHTLCLYETRQRTDHERLTLLAARSFRQDVQLENFNCGEPSPQAVQALLEQARALQTGQPTAPEVPAGPPGNEPARR